MNRTFRVSFCCCWFRFGQPEFLFEFQPLAAKIDEQSNILSFGNEIIHRLDLMGDRQILNRLQFNDEFVLHQKIRRKSSNQNPVIINIKLHF